MGAVIAVLILISIALALLAAALYAVIGKPSSHEGRKRKQEIINGFQLAGGILVGFVLMGSLVGCAGIALGTITSEKASRLIAAVIALSAFILIALTVQRWAKYFAGFIGYGVRNSLIMASSGHLLNSPEIPVSRSLALTMGALCLVSALASQRFTETYKLHVVEKAALMTWIVAFTLGANFERFSLSTLSFGTLAMVFAWCLHHFRWQRGNHRIQAQRPGMSTSSDNG